MSESDAIDISFTCGECGGRVLLPDDHVDESVATCEDCGTEIGKRGDMKRRALKSLIRDVEKGAKKAFKDI